MDTAQLRADLYRDEGRRQYAYDDATGATLRTGDPLQGSLTIGVGWNLSARGLPPVIIDRLLDIAVEDAEAAVQSIMGRSAYRRCAEPRQRALVNMAFNLGETKLRRFGRMWTHIRTGDWGLAAQAAKASRWYRQVGARGDRICRMLEEGT